MTAIAFDWDALPDSLATKLAKHTGSAQRGVPAAQSLRERFGSPPGEDFVHEAWPVLRDAWLASRPEPRAAVISQLRSAGLGHTDSAIRSAAAQVAYLRSCRNTARLRRIVLDEFLSTATSVRADAAKGPAPAASTPVLTGDLLAAFVERLGNGEELRVHDGSGAVLATFVASAAGGIEARVTGPDGLGQQAALATRADAGALARLTAALLGEVAGPSITLVDTAGLERAVDDPAKLPPVPDDGTPLQVETPLRDEVHHFLADRLGIPYEQLHKDEDGDVPFNVGSACFFVRAIESPPQVVVFSPLLLDVEPSQALNRTLSAWSSQHLLRFREWGRVVFAEIVLPGEPFVGDHLDQAVGTMFAVLDELDDRLQQAFGGRRAGDARTKPAPHDGVMAEGGYL